LKIKLLATTAMLLLALTGCAVNRAGATVDPTARLDTLKTFHVKHLPADGRGIDQLIATNLRSRGYSVTTDGQVKPELVDAVVTYEDRWMWDITMYMVELTVVLRDPPSDFGLATGNSFHTSLSRKSPTAMVDEVVGNIFTTAVTKP
jgi:hypothetical protein